MVNNLNLILVLLILIGCAVSSYSDLKYGKISNKAVLIYGSIPVIFNWIILSQEDKWLIYISNSLAVIIIAIVLYAFHIWAGGDCKMLIFIALSSPVSLYWTFDFAECNLFFIYIFVFSFGFIYISLENIIMLYKEWNTIDKSRICNELKSSICKYIQIIILLYAIGHVYTHFIKTYYEVPEIVYVMLCIGIALSFNKVKILSNRWVTLTIASIDLFLMIVSNTFIIGKMWQTYLLVILLMGLRSLAKTFNYEDIKTCEVSQGMILSQETSILLQRSKVKGLPGISNESLKSRLTENEAEAIKRWAKSKYGLEHIRIVRKIPFAIFITMGLIAYWIMGCVYF